ncbi:DgyrCDS1870 [Dimorphilus gyrociliatus]|uniref:DgyrCDS1870 n=1 Tax=Dimorphilus gyrociliatus TaxID=2664684 RepID=A0A7I8V8U7_9ANNE|nr:DgyrCDS1870 [Dimorphilus gyrociliatus]
MAGAGRLPRDFFKLQRNLEYISDGQAEIHSYDENFKFIKLKIVMKDGPYEGIANVFRLSDLANYPECPPELYCETPIFHPNISPPDGEICLNLLDFWNLGSQNFEAVVQGLIFLLREPNMNDPSWGNFDIINLDGSSFHKFIERLKGGDFSVFQEIYDERRLLWTQWQAHNPALDGSESFCSDERSVTSDTDYNSICSLHESDFSDVSYLDLTDDFKDCEDVKNHTEEGQCETIAPSKSFKGAKTPALVRVGRFFSRSFRRLSRTFSRH